MASAVEDSFDPDIDDVTNACLATTAFLSQFKTILLNKVHILNILVLERYETALTALHKKISNVNITESNQLSSESGTQLLHRSRSIMDICLLALHRCGPEQLFWNFSSSSSLSSSSSRPVGDSSFTCICLPLTSHSNELLSSFAQVALKESLLLHVKADGRELLNEESLERSTTLPLTSLPTHRNNVEITNNSVKDLEINLMDESEDSIIDLVDISGDSHNQISREVVELDDEDSLIDIVGNQTEYSTRGYETIEIMDSQEPDCY